ncbi:MAG: hypothetical protein BMS9Abin34_033 [Patescibacteria group bacterium]|nr:MAG: hypothetical protein BMS9Abin34_033 [Patescibacteria group bacterium]
MMKISFRPIFIATVLAGLIFFGLMALSPSKTSAATDCPGGTFPYPNASTCNSLCGTTCYPDAQTGENLCCAVTTVADCPSKTTEYPDAIQCGNACSQSCIPDKEGTVERCCPDVGAGVCPFLTNETQNAAACSGLCAPFGRECKRDSDGVKRCAPWECKAPTCPDGTSSYGTASKCDLSCGGDCVADTVDVARCCKTADSTGTGTNGKTKLGWDLFKKKSTVNIGPWEISTDPAKLGADILKIGYGVGALLAVLFTIIGGFGVATSSGDPDKLEKSKQIITAALAGLLFLLLSWLILKIIKGEIIGI